MKSRGRQPSLTPAKIGFLRWWWMGWLVAGCFNGFDLCLLGGWVDQFRLLGLIVWWVWFFFFSHGFTVLVSLFWSSQLMGLLGFKKMNHGWSAVGRSIWSVAPIDGLIHLMTIDFFFTWVWFIWLWFHCFDLLFWWVCDPSSCSGFDRWRTRRMGLLGLCNESCYGFDRVLGSSFSVLVQWITVLIRSAVLVQWILLACVHRIWVLMKRCVSYFHSCISAHSCVSHLSVYFGYCVAWVPANIKRKRETQRKTWIQIASKSMVINVILV